MTLYVTTGGQQTAVGGAVAYKSAGDFTALPPASYSLVATAGADSISSKATTFEAGHVYTITAYGDMTVTDPKATNVRKLDNTANQ
jgi:hypothetical protein